MMKWKRSLVGVVMLAGLALSAETLFNNRALNVNESGTTGSLWVFSRADIYSGVTLLSLTVGSSGSVQVKKSEQAQLSDSLTATQDGVFTDVLAEHRRTPSVYAGKLGYVLPMYGLNDEGSFLQGDGFFAVRDVNNVEEHHLDIPEAFEESDSTMSYAVSGFAFDSSAKKLWYAQGAAGFGLYDFGSSRTSNTSFALNLETASLDTARVNYKWGKKNPSVFDVKLDSEGDLWMATSKGLWVRKPDGSLQKASSVLDTTARVTGIWMGGEPLQIFAETSHKEKSSTTKNVLWRKLAAEKDFSKVNFLDTAGKAQKKDVYQDGHYSVSNVAFVGKTAFVAVVAGSSVGGYFKVDSAGVRAWDMDGDGRGTWLYGYESGATDRDVVITSICSFPLTDRITGLAISTYGNGISVSADSGKSWNPILNRAKLDNNLGSIRMVPSVILSVGEPSLVSYKVGEDSKITIDVFSYDMRKVRTIVKDAPRDADASRSTKPSEDFWDGYDKYGRACAMGVYYVRVKDNHGHVGWGKVMVLGGRR